MSERPLWRLVAGKKTGPYAPEKLRPLVKDGRISLLDRFSYDGESWAPAPEFPELLREPAATVASPKDETFGVDLTDTPSLEDDFRPSFPVGGDADEDDDATLRLMKIVKWMVGVGGGLIALLLLMTVFTALRGGRAPQPSTAVATVPAESPSVAAASERATERVATGDERAAADSEANGSAPGPEEEMASAEALDAGKPGLNVAAPRTTNEAGENAVAPAEGEGSSPE